MSTNRAPRAGQRPGDYANIGYVGRKTGAVLRDTGIRDEYGMQSIDDLFSPPPRSEASFKTRTQINGTRVAENGAISVSGNQPESSIYSSPRKSLPPRARSPIKTAIGSPRKSTNSSPTKTMALLASPVRMRPTMQAKPGSQGETEKEAFLNNKHKRRSLEQAPRRPAVAGPASLKKSIPQQAIRRSLFDIPSSPAIPQEPAARVNGVKKAPLMHESPKQNGELSGAPEVESDALLLDNVLHNEAYQSEEIDEPDLFVNQRKSPLPGPNGGRALETGSLHGSKQNTKEKGKRRLDDIEAAEQMPIVQPVTQAQPEDHEFEPDIGGFDDDEPDLDPGLEFLDDEAAFDEAENQDEEAPSLPQPKQFPSPAKPSSQSWQAKPLAPKLKRPSPVLDEISESSPPAKKQRLAAEQLVLSPSKGRKSKTITDYGVIDGVPNVGETKSKQRRANKEVPLAQPFPPPSPYKKSRPKARGLQIIKDSVEAEVDGARYTRSGRTTVKPVEYWRGERVIYTEPRREGGRVSLPGIKEVIRVEDEPRANKPAKRKPSRPRKRELSVESQDEPEQEWELAPGVFAGEVPAWDLETQQGDPEYEQVDLAIAPAGLSALTRSGQGRKFQFAKTVTLPFFHSGMVDLPPGGEKTTKNSKRNHMVFWVFSGRVVVDISGNQFSLGRGGMWQVPRGNSYSISNPHNKPARVFFAQGCYMTEAEGEAYEEAEAAGAAPE